MKKAILILCISVLLISCFVFAVSAEKTAQPPQKAYQTYCEKYGHQGAWYTVKAATCTQSGLKEQICTRCGEESTQTIPATGHATYISYSVSSSCTSGGYNVIKCKNCSYSYTQSNGTAPLGHTGAFVVEKAATCTTAGLKVQTCTRCGHETEQTIPATGHNLKSTSYGATCTVGGYTKTTCTNTGCTYSTTSNHTSPLGHTGSYVVEKAATCTATGLAVQTCTRCGREIEQTIPATGHSLKSTTKPATCETDGFTRTICTNSGCTYSTTSNKTPALGHTGSFVVRKPATCTEKGLKVQTCTRCGFDTEQAIPATGHNLKSTSYGATCTSGGYTKTTCTNSGCTYSTTSNHTSPLGHTGPYVVEKAATCTTAGLKVQTCTRCGHETEQEIPATGHNLKSTSHGATCTVGGYTKTTCTNSGCTYSTTSNHTSPLGHTGPYVVEKAATCTTAGLKVQTCTRCGRETEQEIPATGHNYKVSYTEPNCTFGGKKITTCENPGCDYRVTESDGTGPIDHIGPFNVQKSPTCTEDGYSLRICTRCGEETTKRLPATGHQLVVSYTKPSCLFEGSEITTCENPGCDYRTVEPYGDPLEHIGPFNVEKPATCTEDGIALRICTRCGEETTKAIPATGHHLVVSYTEPSCLFEGSKITACDNPGCDYRIVEPYGSGLLEHIGPFNVEKPATCTEDGIALRICTRCGEETTKAIPATGHHLVVSYTEPSCLFEGSKITACDNPGCDYRIVESYGSGLLEHIGSFNVEKPATCTEDGIALRICTRCGEETTKAIPALGHDLTETFYGNSCVTGGYSVITCKRSGCDYYSKEEGGGHIGPFNVQTPATCTEEGFALQICTRCGEETTKPIPPTGHKFKYYYGGPTCSTGGYVERTCENPGCNYRVIEPDGVPPLGHTGPFNVETPATCTETGTAMRNCTRCGAEETQPIAPIGHKFSTYYGGPSCTTGGYIRRTCENPGCDYIVIAPDGTPPLGHTGPFNEVVPATCVETGIAMRSCTRCGEEETQTIPLTDHKIKSYYGGPSCTTGGYVERTCENAGCDYYVRASDGVPPLGHTGPFNVEIPSTCISEGLAVRRCTRCGREDEKTLPLSGHKKEEQIEKEPTETEEGVMIVVCKHCGFVFWRYRIPCISKDSIYDVNGNITVTVYLNKRGHSSTIATNELAEFALVDNEGEWHLITKSSNGSVTFRYEGGSITVTSTGYKARTYSEDVIRSGRTTFYLDPENDKTPFIMSVMMDGVDLLHQSYILPPDDKGSHTITTEIDWGTSAFKSITLSDGKTSVSLRDGATSVNLSDSFDFVGTFVIVATDIDGNRDTRTLQLEKETYESIMGEFSISFPVPIYGQIPGTVPVFGGQTIGAALPFVPFSYCIEDGKVYVGIGESCSGSDAKEYAVGVKNMGASYKSGGSGGGNGSFGFDCDYSVKGYMLGVIQANGKIVWQQTGIFVEGKVGKGFEFPFAIGPVPAFVEVAVSAAISADGYLSTSGASAGVNLDLAGTLSVSGGVGVGQADILSLSGGVEGSLSPTWNVGPGGSHFRLTASLALYAKVTALGFEYTYETDPIAEAVWYDSGSRHPAMAEMLKDMDIYNTDAYKLQDLSYLMEGSSFMPEQFNKKAPTAGSAQVVDFITNAYEDARPQLGVFSNGTMLAVWVGSDQSGDVNGLRLMASYFNGTTWSQPVSVEQDGTMDANPELVVIDDVAYIVWQDANGKIELTDSLDDVAGKLDITLATYDSKSNTFAVEPISCDEILDMMPTVTGEDGEAYVVWVNNTDNTLFGGEASNAILAREISNGVVGKVEVLYDTLSAVSSMAASYEDGKMDVAYIADRDGNLATEGDSEVYLNGSALAENDVAESNLLFHNGELYWFAAGDLMNMSGEVYAGIGAEQIRMVESENGRIVLFNKYDGLKATLYSLFYDKETQSWGDPIALTDGVHAISAFSAIMDSNGMLRLLASEMKVEKEIGEENPYGKTDLKLIAIPLGVDVAVSDIRYNSAEYVDNRDMMFAVDVTNNGGMTAKGVTVIVTDGIGTELQRDTFGVELIPGESTTLNYMFHVANAQPEQQLNFTVVPAADEDCNSTNNSVQVVIDHRDITLEQISWGMNVDGELVVGTNIVNRSYSPVNSAVTVSLREDSAEGTVLDTVVIENMTAMQMERVSFLTEYEEDKVYFLTLEATEGNDNRNNDADFVIVYGYSEEEVETPTEDATVNIYHSLNLESDISLNYAVRADQLAGADNYYLECVLPVYDGNAYVGNKTVRVEPVENGAYYYFTLTGLASINMNDELEAKLYFSRDGENFVSVADTYSIARYAYSQLNKDTTGTELKKLCAELLRYGTSAQLYKGYRTNALADSNMTDEHRAYLCDLDTVTLNKCNEVLNDLENATVQWVGKSLVLDQKVELKYIFSLDNYNGAVSDLTMQISFVNISGEMETVTVSGAEVYNSETNLYAMTFDGLLAAELRTPVSAKIYSGNEQVSCTLRYSAESYGIGKTGTLGSLCKAVIAYSDSAKEFYSVTHR